jgi:hypothetical protein
MGTTSFKIFADVLERTRTLSHHWNRIRFRQKPQRRERGEPARRRHLTTFCFEAFTGVPKGESKEGDLECSRCWCGVVVESTRASWRDNSSGIPDPSADCGLAAPPRKLLQN